MEGSLAMRVLYHDKCFDGACSAALFTRFHRECIGGDGAYDYRGLLHKAGGMGNEIFGEGENAIVDFKYTTSPRLTWWFDHHLSAFASDDDRRHFETVGVASGRQFYDAEYTSCTTFIAHIAKTRFGFDTTGLEELLYWADIVDGAKYESAKAAVEMEAPAMKLTLVIENATGDLVPRMIPLLTAESLQQVLDRPFVQERVAPLLEQHWRALEVIRERSTVERGVITFDLTDVTMEAYSKFIPYYLFPNATYVVGLSKSSFRTKISVGTNPWFAQITPPVAESELINLAAICERFGGGGHARVGAISLGLDQEDEARRVAGVIAGELRAGNAQG